MKKYDNMPSVSLKDLRENFYHFNTHDLCIQRNNKESFYIISGARWAMTDTMGNVTVECSSDNHFRIEKCMPGKYSTFQSRTYYAPRRGRDSVKGYFLFDTGQKGVPVMRDNCEAYLSVNGVDTLTIEIRDAHISQSVHGASWMSGYVDRDADGDIINWYANTDVMINLVLNMLMCVRDDADSNMAVLRGLQLGCTVSMENDEHVARNIIALLHEAMENMSQVRENIETLRANACDK